MNIMVGKTYTKKLNRSVFVLECTTDGKLIAVLQDKTSMLGTPQPGSRVADFLLSSDETAFHRLLTEAQEQAIACWDDFYIETPSGRNNISISAFVADNRVLITGSFREPAEESMEKQVKQAKESLEVFAYTVSHDLREPVRMVKSFMELLLKKYGETLDEKAKSYIGYATDGAGRLDIMIQDLLHYYRCTRDMEIQPADMNEVVKKAEAKLHTVLADRGVRLAYGALPVIAANADGMQTVAEHVIRQLLPALLETPAPVIRVSSSSIQGNRQIEFSCNGAAPDPGQLRDIFNLFYNRAQQGTAGSALNGMAVAKRIIEHLGGSISVMAATEGGMAVLIILPGELL